MKKLSRNEMKNEMGGNAPLGGDGEGNVVCNTTCSHTSGNTTTSGSCSKENITIGGVTTQYCKCAVSQGSGCNA